MERKMPLVELEELVDQLDLLRDDPSIEFNSLEDQQISDVIIIVNDLIDKCRKEK